MTAFRLFVAGLFVTGGLFAQTAGNDVVIPVTSTDMGTDAVPLAVIDDGANSPSAGDFITVDTGDATITYVTPNAGTDVTDDLEEENHAFEHSGAGNDAIVADGIDAGTGTTRTNEVKIQISSHDDDCTALTDGFAREQCYQEDTGIMYICKPSAGDCDTPAEWVPVAAAAVEVNNLETTDPPNVLINEIYIGTGGATGAWTTPVPVVAGGIGVATLTDGGILIGNGTGGLVALGVATNGQIPIGDGTTDPVLANITAEAGAEITVSNGAGTIELDVNEANLDLASIGGTLGTGQGATGYRLESEEHANTDVTADLEEEGQINATAVTGNAADDQVIVGSGASAAAYKTIPDCNTDNNLTYTQSTNTIGCEADDGGTTAIDALGDVGAGDDVVGLAEEGQTWNWVTAATAAAIDGLTLNMTNSSATADGDTQRLLRLVRPEGTQTRVVESLLSIENLEVEAVVDDGIIIRSAAGGITDALDLNDPQIVNLITHASGSITSAELAIIDDGTITLTSEVTGTLPVENGGTEATSFTDGGMLVGGGTGPITALGVATNGQIPIGDGTTAPVLAVITAEAGAEITVVNGAGSIQLDVNEANLDLASIGGTLAASSNANAVRDRKASWNLPDPVAGDDGDYQVEFPAACTLQEVACNVQAATSVVISLYERARATPETGTTNMMTSTLTCDTNGAVTTSFTDAALAADVPLALGIGTVTGTPALLRVHVKCRTD